MAFQEFELRTKGMLKKKKSIIMECFRISWRELNALSNSKLHRIYSKQILVKSCFEMGMANFILKKMVVNQIWLNATS